MKKQFLTIVMSYFIVVLIGAPAIIENNKIVLSQAQEIEYQRSVQNRPEVNSYNPLQLGNKWWFEYNWIDPGQPSTTILGREVVDSSMINDENYYEVYGTAGTPGIGFWIKNEGDSVIVWEQNDFTNDIDGDSLTTWLVSEDFTITTTTPSNPVWLWTMYDPNFQFGCYLVESGWSLYYGVLSEFRTYNYIPMYGDLFYTLVWVRGFGVVYYGTDSCDANLVGCIINGVPHGNTSNEDNNITEYPDLGLSIYPNPLQFSTSISFRLSRNETKASLSIYNIKGQCVNRKNLGNNSNYIWNGKDQNGYLLSQGVYLVCLKTSNNRSTSRKITLLR